MPYSHLVHILVKKTSCIASSFSCSPTTIKFPQKHLQVSYSFTRKSSNIIYAILCKRCPMIYIGETERSLSTRFKEHLANIRKKRILTVGPHFNSALHTILDAQVLIFQYYYSSTLDRKTLEAHFVLNRKV